VATPHLIFPLHAPAVTQSSSTTVAIGSVGTVLLPEWPERIPRPTARASNKGSWQSGARVGLIRYPNGMIGFGDLVSRG
jgi:hypothetical protein